MSALKSSSTMMKVMAATVALLVVALVGVAYVDCQFHVATQSSLDDLSKEIFQLQNTVSAEHPR